MKKQLWEVRVVMKDGSSELYKIAAKDDVAARQRAIEAFATSEQAIYDKLKKEDAQNGELLKGKNAYAFDKADIAYCETSFYGTWDE